MIKVKILKIVTFNLRNVRNSDELNGIYLSDHYPVAVNIEL